ncbi:MAG TPA: NnrU family protein [Gammaproteobacteria bacterium]
MLILIAGLILFFIPHSVSIVNEPWRNRMAARLGEQRWQGLYSLVALAGFILIIWGYGLARADAAVVYTPAAGLRHLAWLLMLPVFPLLIATYAPGRLRTATKHPMLLATLLWSAAHLLVNGNLPDLLLFGTFFLWALADRISMTQRTQRPLQELPPSRFNDLIAIAAGLGLYLAFLFGVHGWLIGVPLLR